MDQTTKSQTTRTRRQTYIIPKRSFTQRYPLTTIWAGTIGGLLVFFSRPIYDAFFREQVPTEIPEGQTPREALMKAWRI